MKQFFALLVASLLSLQTLAVATVFTARELTTLKRVAAPTLSPDGKTVVFSVGTLSEEDNKYVNQVYRVDIDGTNLQQLTFGKSSSSTPAWSPDGQSIAYVTKGQVWTMSADGKNARQITNISTGADAPRWSSDGKWLAFVSDVDPTCDSDACNKAKIEAADKNPVKARVADRLLFRHWNEWREKKRTHVFRISAEGGMAQDLTPGDFDSPPYGASSDVNYAFSPDGKNIAVLKNLDPIEAVSTNSDVFIQALDGSVSHNVTKGMNGYDTFPTFSPDGRYLFFLSMARAGFEADRARLMRYDTQSHQIVELTKGFDRGVSEFIVSADGNVIYFIADDNGFDPIFSVPVEPDFASQKAGSFVAKLYDGITASHLSLSHDGSTLVFLTSSFQSPPEVMRLTIKDKVLRPLTKINAEALAAFELPAAESIRWKDAGGTSIQGFLLKPASFDPSKKYPLVALIHGGPQLPWASSWSNRWNPQLYTNQGYVVFLPNFHGSIGFGQRFTDSVSGNWGGKSVIDVMDGIAEVIKNPWVDASRIGAAGGSYGGFMVDWILGHNNDPRFKIKAFFSHAGVFNLESMALATEELWFVNWEFKGMPWENKTNYRRWSAHNFIQNFSAPTLVTCGELDYRVPYDQSLQLFTALQLKGVPSKLVVFPDEGHWILKPQNLIFWYDQIFSWFHEHL